MLAFNTNIFSYKYPDLGDGDPQTDSLFIMNKRVSLNQLVKETHFNAKELKALYRGFKTTTPSALIHRG